MTMTSNIGVILDVISKNPQDVEDLIQRFGGIGNLLRAAPALYRVAKTVAEANKDNPDAAAEHVVRVLEYSDATKERVRTFQKNHGLTADGIVGNRTWGKVEELLKGK